mmetsp:Transcript_4972/g.14731  ORF Transcript_4972/g.14731 Transcript_4972/m.14731 type:complete len:195 (-) Transcript_4972:81-665(-)
MAPGQPPAAAAAGARVVDVAAAVRVRGAKIFTLVSAEALDAADDATLRAFAKKAWKEGKALVERRDKAAEKRRNALNRAGKEILPEGCEDECLKNVVVAFLDHVNPALLKTNPHAASRTGSGKHQNAKRWLEYRYMLAGGAFRKLIEDDILEKRGLKARTAARAGAASGLAASAAPPRRASRGCPGARHWWRHR